MRFDLAMRNAQGNPSGPSLFWQQARESFATKELQHWTSNICHINTSGEKPSLSINVYQYLAWMHSWSWIPWQMQTSYKGRPCALASLNCTRSSFLFETLFRTLSLAEFHIALRAILASQLGDFALYSHSWTGSCHRLRYFDICCLELLSYKLKENSDTLPRNIIQGGHPRTKWVCMVCINYLTAWYLDFHTSKAVKQPKLQKLKIQAIKIGCRGLAISESTGPGWRTEVTWLVMFLLSSQFGLGIYSLDPYTLLLNRDPLNLGTLLSTRSCVRNVDPQKCGLRVPERP